MSRSTSTRRRRTGRRTATGRRSTSTSTTSARTSPATSSGTIEVRDHGRLRHPAPPAAEVLPPRLPRHGVDPAGRGRAPPAVGADGRRSCATRSCRPDLLSGSLADLGISIPLAVALPPPQDRALSDVWSALGGELKPSLDLSLDRPAAARAVRPTPARRSRDEPLSRWLDSVADGDGSETQRRPAGARGPSSRASPAPPPAAAAGRADRAVAADPTPDVRPRCRATPSLAHLLGRLDVAPPARRRRRRRPPGRRRGARRPVPRAVPERRRDRRAAAQRPGLGAPATSPPNAGRPSRRRPTPRRAGAALRLRALADRFGLDDLDVELLLTAMAPDVDDRFERYYGYLNDDVTRRRVSVGLALGLAGASTRRAPPAGAASSRAAGSSAAGCSRSTTPTGRSSPGPCGCPIASPPTCSAATSPTPRWRSCSSTSRRRPSRRSSRWCGPSPTPTRSSTCTTGEATRDARSRRRRGARPACRSSSSTSTGSPRRPTPTASSTPRSARPGCAAACSSPVRSTRWPRPTSPPSSASRRAPVPLVLTGHRGWEPAWADRPPVHRRGARGSSAAARAADLGDGARRATPATASTPPTVTAPVPARRRADPPGRRRRGDDRRSLEDRAVDADRRPPRRPPAERRPPRAPGPAHRAGGRRGTTSCCRRRCVAGLRGLADRARHRERVLGEWRMRPGGGRGIGHHGAVRRRLRAPARR